MRWKRVLLRYKLFQVYFSSTEILIKVATSVIEYGLLYSCFILAIRRYVIIATHRWMLTAFFENPHKVLTTIFYASSG